MIYFIEAKDLGLVKIGFAINVARRLSALQIGTPVNLALIDAVGGDWADEQRLHRALSHQWCRGEWFRRPAAMWALRILRKRGVGAIADIERMNERAKEFRSKRAKLVRAMVSRKVKSLATDVLALPETQIKQVTGASRKTWQRAEIGSHTPELHTAMNAFSCFPHHLAPLLRVAFGLDVQDRAELFRPIIPRMVAVVDEADAMKVRS